MVSPAATPSAGLDTLLARPPTPPRERQVDLDPKLNLDRHAVVSRLTLQTPPSHSPESALSTNASSRRSRKRVEFTVQAEYCHPSPNPRAANEHKQHSTPVSVLSSIGLSKPLKSILKHTSSPSPLDSLDPSACHGEPEGTATLAAMLESTIKHLAGNDRDSKVDAYTMLVRALKTSTNLPDRIALQSKMSLFTQFIQRDITLKGANGSIDSSLVNHALSLLSTFLLFPAIASKITSDSAVFIVDHCIRSFEDDTVPKDVVRHLMQVVAYQDFAPKVMTADRVGRLVISLHNIENHVTGKSIIMSRILIYRRLIGQSTNHMVSHSEWLRDLFTDMLSSLKEIRSAAIILGLEASFTVAKEKQVSKKVMEILQMSVEETRYAEYYIQALTTMTKEKSQMAAVPQIWSVVVLLLRCPMDRWEFFDRWLAVIQRCFNSGDYQTKLEANYAWNRLIYALHLYESSFSKMIGTLIQPFNQLRRRGKQPDELRKVVIGGLCNLYYYAFKPNSSSSHIDQYWDICVKTLIRTLAFPENDGKTPDRQQPSSVDNLSQAIAILAALFDSSGVRLWKEDRIAENTLATAAELPPLDPKWIRRNAARVFSVTEPIIVKSFLELADPQSALYGLWRSLIGALAAAASKEVKVSTDTAAFLGNALSLLARIWAAGLGKVTASADMQRSFLKATEAYLTTIVLSIGHLPFTEKLFSINKQQTLVPVATPSHRSGKGHGPIRSSLHHLFSMLSLLPPGISDGEGITHLFKAIFEPFIITRSTRARRDLVHDLMQIPQSEEPVNCGPWVFIAEVLATPVDNSQSSDLSTDSASQSPIGHDFRDIVKHLERGINHMPNLQWCQWLSLFHFVVGQATELSGEAGCSVAVVEPLAKAVFESLGPEPNSISPNVYKCGLQLICSAKHPRDRQALDAARRRLWGTTVAGVRSASFDPFDNLYRLTSRLLGASYTAINSLDEDILSSLITETSHFLSRSNQILVFKSLVQLQEGLGPWIQDVDERYGGKQRSTVAEAVKLLWDRICNLFADTTLDHFQLDAIKKLLCCAFKSKHRHIVNSAVLLWNRGFESASEIQYPAALRGVLLSLRPYADIALPGLDALNSDAGDLVPQFVESQDDLGVITSSDIPGQGADSALNPSSPLVHLQTPRSKQTTSAEDLRSHSRSRSARSTRSSRRARASKLRHDDSQIQFATIEESSPSARANESQVLTDRQKEVRERQLENAALFQSIRPSPKKGKGERLISVSRQASPQKLNIDQVPTTDRSTTPKVARSFEYVASTPTPRRGHHLMIDEDHELTDDVPSSPPEPRRNLLPEMKSHSRDTRMLDDMPISSSPISGSPIAKSPPRAREQQLESQEGHIHTTAEPVSTQLVLIEYNPITTVSGNISTDSKEEITLDESVAGVVTQGPWILPNLHSSKAEGIPKSNSEVFADVVVTTQPQERPNHGAVVVPSQLTQEDESELKGRSFEMSDGEEHSMARLVIELDSRKCDPLPGYNADSPPKAHRDKGTKECIAVQTSCEQAQKDLIRSQAGQLTPLVTPNHTESDDSQPTELRIKKRKRVTDKKQNTRSKRRRRNTQIDKNDNDDDDDDDDAMGNQVTPAAHEQLPLGSDVEPVETDGAIEGRELRDEVPFLLSQGSPDLSYNPGDQSFIEGLELDSDGMDSDTAVNLQLITEASQQSEANHSSCPIDDEAAQSPTSDEAAVVFQGKEPMQRVDTLKSEPPDGTRDDTTPQVTQSVVERITASLRDGLEGLRAATLSREDVYKIESMFMDIKKELYEAERRSR
ncbi:Rap1-interacting factor 1 N terminal-domain-containing protein [Nemania serpens]|nr:Rap1-interacting factor 1 N terminal-domain-containing protein [Nemania serpens]